MTARGQRFAAMALAVPAGVVMLVCAGLLVGEYVSNLRHAPAEKRQIAALEQAVRQDASQSAALAAEYDRQTQASLRREARARLQGKSLLAAAVVFLVAAKWWLSIGKSARPVISRDVLLQAAGKLAKSGPGSNGEALPAGNGHDCRCAAQIDVSFADAIISRLGFDREAAIPVLQAVQEHYGYLPDAVLQRVCERTQITPAQIAGVASFYRHFRRKPAGRHVVRVCHGTACHVAGAEIVSEELRRHLGIPAGEDTDPARQFTVEPVACMGCCTLAPVVQVDGATRGHLTPDLIPAMIDECLSAGGGGDQVPQSTKKAIPSNGHPRAEIRVGVGSCCVAGGSGKVYEALERAVSASGLPVHVKRVGCVGMCHRTPLVEAVLPGRDSALYATVRPEEALSIVQLHFRPKSLRRRVRRVASTAWKVVRGGESGRPLGRIAFGNQDPPVAAFLDRQKHIATEHCGVLDPTDLDEYMRHGGFESLRRCLETMNGRQVVDEIRASGLRGRGGAGFPTGTKWARVRAAAGDEKYVICNGDEGDPGAFMDRMLMESFPYRVIEGMAIAAFAVGANRGYFYIRAEYPLAVRRIRDAIAECERRGLLGDRVLGADFSLRLAIMEGAGAFVCGEETALLASIEGGRGTPRLRPPFPAEKGLHEKPTLINNVETYATVPWIIRHGASEFSALGTPTSKGTKVFALAGKVRRGGLIEVPMGVTIRQIVEEIGGGVKDGRRFKAVQIGGPSGGCVPAELADLPVDYEALASAGAIMGSGGLVVMDDSDCMVDIARYFLAFTQDQSCGKCTYCRVGTRRMLDILERICEGRGRKGDLEELESLAGAVKNGSLCGLGRTAPNPVLTTLRYFREEYEAHIAGRCPSRRCKGLIHYRVTDRCTGCTICARNCGAEAIAFTPYEQHHIDDDKCTRCGICLIKCPEDAIVVE